MSQSFICAPLANCQTLTVLSPGLSLPPTSTPSAPLSFSPLTFLILQEEGRRACALYRVALIPADLASLQHRAFFFRCSWDFSERTLKELLLMEQKWLRLRWILGRQREHYIQIVLAFSVYLVRHNRCDVITKASNMCCIKISTNKWAEGFFSISNTDLHLTMLPGYIFKINS